MIEHLLKDWGISITDDEYIPEYLIKRYPSKCFYIDSLPMPISESRIVKFDQLEELLYKKMQEAIFNIIIKLWLYNDVFCKSDLIYEKQTATKIKKIYPKKYHIFHHITSQSNFIKIDDLEQLKLLLELSYKNIIDILLLFDSFQLIIVPSWSCYFLFFNDISKIKLVKEIINVEGLYLRPYITEDDTKG